MDTVFEVVDASSDETYYSLGIFLSKEAAMSLLDGAEPPHNEDDPEAVTIEVRSRPVGFYPHSFTPVARRTWVRNYDDTLPDWSALPIELHTPNKS
jgi:hypothetical protein